MVQRGLEALVLLRETQSRIGELIASSSLSYAKGRTFFVSKDGTGV
jgi:hypothetical protein